MRDVEDAVRAVERALTDDAPAPSEAAWLSWLVVSLARQRHRQRWHHEVQRTLLASRGRGRGTVPGLPA